jgi:methylenetetrahydrofolate reductase (NADPH)
MPADAALSGRMASWLRDCSIEVSPKDELAGPELRGLFTQGTVVFVNNPPSVTHHDIVAACGRLTAAGFIAVPHIVARHLGGFTQANDFLARVAGEAGVTQVLLLGGDLARPAGPFASALDVLATGVVERHGVSGVAFAGYPEGHPLIDRTRLDGALLAKIELARARGLDVSLVTQFGFEPEPIERFIRTQREAGTACAIRIGVSGPASVATLAKYAVRCGIGASLRALARRHAAFARILTEATPANLIEALSGSPILDDSVGLHVFCFGGVRRTAEWRREMLAGSCP